MKKGDSAWSTLAYIILGIVIAYSINLGLSLALGTSIPVVAVESNSMVPTFAKGDMLILRGVPASNLTIGDIIVYSPEGQNVPIVHRIIAINPDGSFQTKGDANGGQLPFEKQVTASEIHGMVIFIIPYVGWIKIAITDYVIPNALWVIAIVVVAYAVLTIAPRARMYIKRSDKI